MTFKFHESKVKSIRPGDKRFLINDGMVTTPRAMIHILPECPQAFRDQINYAIAHGWLKAVANVTERELIFMGLTDEL
jgi:hypothetical protein